MKKISIQQSNQGPIRLLIILLYFIIIFPGMFLAGRRFAVSSDWLIQTIINIVIVIAFFSLELIEYFFWRYRYDNKAIPRLFLFIRLVLVLIPFIFSKIVPSVFRVTPEITALLALFSFYFYFSFNRIIATLLSLLIILVQLVPGLIGPPPGHSSEALGFFFFRIATIAFFYLLAWLWEIERNRSDENHKLLADLHESEAQLRIFADKIGKTVALEERTRIARDLHDSIGHALTAINIQLSKAKAYFQVDQSVSLDAIEAARESASDAMQDIRESIGRLTGEASFDLRQQIPKLLSRLKENDIKTSFVFEGKEADYNYAVLIGLFRFVQEGVTNILKHSMANTVELRIDLGATEGSIILKDNGKGFDPQKITNDSSEHSHLGLKGLKRRFELVGGIMTVESTPGGGTILNAKVSKNPINLIGKKHA